MRLEKYLEQAREQLVREVVLSDEFIDFMEENKRPMETMMAYYRCAVMEVETKFKVLNEQFSLQYDRNPIESIKTRVKSMESLMKKMRTKNVSMNLDDIEENIRDIAGVRVVCSFPEDIYLLAELLLKQDDIILLEKKDYIRNPKPSGYRSLHLIVEVPIFLQDEKRMMKVEVQLRTIAMDFWASLEHKLRYKKNIPQEEAHLLAQELEECARISESLDQRMEAIRDRIANVQQEEMKKEKKESISLINPLRLLGGFQQRENPREQKKLIQQKDNSREQKKLIQQQENPEEQKELVQQEAEIRKLPVDREWIDNAICYHIYPLGFTGAPRYNEKEAAQEHRILKVLEWIPHLKSLGINVVYFGPVFESGSHGYDTWDYYKTDSRLGSKEDFQKVFGVLHQNGIRVILDGVFNHVGRGFFAFEDLQKHLESSAYKDWFCNLNFSWNSPLGDPFSYEDWHGAAELVKLNLRNPAVCDYLLGAVEMWMEELGIDGLRLDAADCVDQEFFRRLRSFTKGRREDFWLMGEIIHGDYRIWANNEMLDSVTNYECWKGIYSSHNDKNYFEIAHSLKRQFGQGGLYENLRLYNFLDNHDVNRIGTLLTKKENLKNVYTLLYLMPGIPSIYYGSEWGIEGRKGQGMDADLPLRPELKLEQMERKNPELIAHLEELAKVRLNSNAVKKGSYEDILIRNEQFVFARAWEEEQVLTALNLADHSEVLNFHYRGKDYEVELDAYSSQVIPGFSEKWN